MLPNAVCRRRAFSLRTVLFLFRLTEYNGVGSRKCVCWFLHYIMKSGQIILIVPQRFCCLPPMMTSQSDTSCCVHQGFTAEIFPASSQSLLISKSMPLTLPGRHREAVGAWNRLIQISPLPHSCCGAMFIPHIKRSYRQQSKQTDQLSWLWGAGGSSLAAQS